MNNQRRIVFRSIAVLAVIVAAFLFYRFVFVGSSTEEPAGVVSVTSVSPAAQVDNEFLRLLERLERINLDISVFNHPVWESLENFHQELVSEPRGRRNPFSVTGNDVASTTNSATTSSRGL
ncbi:MAG: hypothetical protein AAB505_00575 [Patescibacteria group bacterium]